MPKSVRVITTAAIMVVASFASASAEKCREDSVYIVNGTRTAMVSLQVRETSRGEWQEILRGTPLGVQRSKSVCLSSGRLYDLRADFIGGLHVEKSNQPLRSRPIYVVTAF